MQIGFSSLKLPKKGVLVALYHESAGLGGQAKALDKSLGGFITDALKTMKFEGKKNKFYAMLRPGGSEYTLVIVQGVGKDAPAEKDMADLGGALQAYLEGMKLEEAVVTIESPFKGVSSETLAANMAFGARLRSYRFLKYYKKKQEEQKTNLKKITYLVDKEKEAKKQYDELLHIADGVFLARDVITEPPNIIYPASYASRVDSHLSELGVKVDVLNVADMKKFGMGALLGVGQGSAKDPRMVVMQWNGGGKGKQPVAFVGKGVTFDSGGLSIKPASGMEEMKYDMAGSAAVYGLMHTLAARKAKVNAVGVIGLVENMLGSNAQRPSDVVSTMSGQTVEVLNTDAEGRLVLADALWYTQDRFKPQFVVDLATLTGAIKIALSVFYAGIFSNNDALSEKLIASGNKTGERLWRFPMGDEYDKLIDSDIADMQNIAKEGSGGGSITASQFLQRFVNNVPWAHLDIAGTAWTKKEKDTTPRGATGFGIRLLNQLVADHYEGK